MSEEEIKKPKNPCFKCPDRWAECHGNCEKYKIYVKENEEFKKAVNKKKDLFRIRGEWSDTKRKQLTGKGRKMQ